MAGKTGGGTTIHLGPGVAAGVAEEMAKGPVSFRTKAKLLKKAAEQRLKDAEAAARAASSRRRAGPPPKKVRAKRVAPAYAASKRRPTGFSKSERAAFRAAQLEAMIAEPQRAASIRRRAKSARKATAAATKEAHARYKSSRTRARTRYYEESKADKAVAQELADKAAVLEAKARGSDPQKVLDRIAKRKINEAARAEARARKASARAKIPRKTKAPKVAKVKAPRDYSRQIAKMQAQLAKLRTKT
jgi:hypothetical protein